MDRAPDRIWLQVGENEVTWSEDQINESDVEYIRRDTVLDLIADVKEVSQKLLLVRMREISEAHFAAGWMKDLEFDLWDVAEAGGGPLGLKEVLRSQAAELIDLAEIAGGWWVWEGGLQPRFLPLEQWRVIYELHQTGLEIARESGAI